MSKQIRISDLMNLETAKKYEPELMQYFSSGGTWKELLHYDDSVMESHYKIAYDFYLASDYQKAASAFSYLTLLNPYEFTYWMGLGVSKQADKAYEEAIVAYTVAGAIQASPLPHYHLAQCYYALEQKDLAKEHLTQCLDLAKNLPEHQDLLQRVQVLLNNLPK